ncbi:MAG: GNAT family N-acetyltransferase [Bacteroidia bacterium]|nr:GNAT family N-acetyltransferase [Bacteroidia bacterium]
MYAHLLKNSSFSFQDYSIVPLREQDILRIKDWRNAQLDVLRQKRELTNEDQVQYYDNTIKQTFIHPTPSQMLFSFLQSYDCIGYGGITNIDWESKRTELSFLLDTVRANTPTIYVKEFSIFITLIKQLIFDDLQFNRVFTETYDIRPLHISILENNGFVFEGRLRHHVMINGELVDSLFHGFIKEQYVNKK